MWPNRVNIVFRPFSTLSRAHCYVPYGGDMSTRQEDKKLSRRVTGILVRRYGSNLVIHLLLRFQKFASVFMWRRCTGSRALRLTPRGPSRRGIPRSKEVITLWVNRQCAHLILVPFCTPPCPLCPRKNKITKSRDVTSPGQPRVLRGT